MTDRRFAFIRAINTGGRRLTNEQVVEPFRELGFDDVAAYQAAGNVAFHSSDQPDRLEPLLEQALSASYGFEAPTFVRTIDDLRATVGAQPFTDEQLADTAGRVQLTFLRRPPTDEQLGEVRSLTPSDDLVHVVDDHWFWLPRAGVSDSALPIGRIESVFGPMTMRTLGTVDRMLRKFSD